MARAKVRAEIDLDGRKFSQGVTKAKTEVKGFGKQIGGLKTLVAGAFSVGLVGRFARSVISLGSELSDLADQAGLTADEFQALEFAVLDAGGKSGLVTKTMVKLQQSIGAANSGLASYVDAFGRLGIEMDDLTGKSGPELLEMLAKADSVTRDYDLSLILGARNASRMTEVLRKLGTDGFGKMEEDARSSVRFLDSKTLATLDELEDKLTRAKRAAAGFFGRAINDIIDIDKALFKAGKAFIVGKDGGGLLDRTRAGYAAAGESMRGSIADVGRRTQEIDAQRKIEADTAKQVKLQEKQLAEEKAYRESFESFYKDWQRRTNEGTF